ncbi:alginate export family protein [Nevskia ramosa]|uniref:alginate export family protein n=1 Tax=Nevskia ramosa TaxID=64002 RepID=UPI000420703A|nr:alginate export family protein [Nevskia ramosa]
MFATKGLQGVLRATISPTGAALMLLSGAAQATDSLADLPAKLAAGKTNLDVRLRYEALNLSDPLAAPITENTAQATTIRVRLGYTTAAWNELDGQLEYEGVDTLGDDRYNSLRNGRSTYPVIADAQVHEVNQAWLRYTGLPKTQIKYGRQRINFDNQRFVGGVAWRQDEQTFDAALLTTTLIPKTTVTYAHLDRVNSFRNFAIEGRNVDRLDIDGHLINVSTQVIDKTLKLTGYGYFLDFGTVPGGAVGRLLNNNQTYGLRATGTVPVQAFTLGYSLEYAIQQGWRGSPDHDMRYGLAEAAVGWKMLKATAGYEALGGNGISSFQTPLATTHAFDGWADQFLITPVGGLHRLYASACATVAKTSLTAVYHDFSADTGGAHYGNEVDLLASYPVLANLTVFAKFAAYFADEFPVVAGQASNVKRGWLYAEYKF